MTVCFAKRARPETSTVLSSMSFLEREKSLGDILERVSCAFTGLMLFASRIVAEPDLGENVLGPLSRLVDPLQPDLAERHPTLLIADGILNDENL